MKRDSEIKILLACADAEIDDICVFYNESRFMRAVLLRRPR
jgi:hypothetical protein